MNKDHFLSPGENKIGFARKMGGVKTVPVTHCMDETSNKHLWTGVLGANESHDFRPALRCYGIHQNFSKGAVIAVPTGAQSNENIPLMQASMFVPNPRWSARLAAAVQELNLDIKWRTESRVDALLPEAIPHLARAGLKILDLGLETASPTQIIAMKNANNPERYLTKASALLQACRDAGVMAKVNVLLYAGETRKTLAETTQWLDAHASCIAGVSVGPVVAYGPPATANILLDEWSLVGARPVDTASAGEIGVTRMHLSKEFDADQAELASLEVSRRFMSQDAYFTLKSFSYYPRDYDRADFDRDVTASASRRLPFELVPAPVQASPLITGS